MTRRNFLRIDDEIAVLGDGRAGANDASVRRQTKNPCAAENRSVRANCYSEAEDYRWNDGENQRAPIMQ